MMWVYHRVLVGVFIRVGVANKAGVSSCIGGCVHKSGCG